MKYIFKKKQFDKFLGIFKGEDKKKILFLFYEISGKIKMPVKKSNKIMTDFAKAIFALYKRGKSVDEICHVFDKENLGNFYCEEVDRWFPLDNSAKIYPLSMDHQWMAMFRMSVYLKEDVVPEVLQIALLYTIKRFPYFASTVKDGFFWHYLDGVQRRFPINEENMRPCSSMKRYRSNQIPLRVIYYKNRISVEYFHILTDGTGGLIFLKTLVAEYLRLLGAKIECSSDCFNVNDEPQESEWSNDFVKAEKVGKSVGFGQPTAKKIKGKLSRVKPDQVLHFEMDAKELVRHAKNRGATVTALMLSYIAIACKAAADEKSSGDVQMQVPVNMRKFYESNTLRNFSLFGTIKLKLDDITDVDRLVPLVTEQLFSCASKKNLNEIMLGTNSLVNGIKYIPLPIKSIVAKPIYHILSDRTFTNTLSNVGVVSLPEGMKEYVEKMDFTLGTAMTNKATMAMITCNNVAVVSITKMTKDDTFENALYNILESDGMKVLVKGSESYENRNKLPHNKQ
ncbi:MAG: hypothetical protein RRZ69_02755 [Clostridia bacterium]